MPKVNWGDDGVLPEGSYTLRVQSVSSSFDADGNEIWHVFFEVIDPPDAKGKRMSDRWLWSEKALWYVKKVLAAIFPEDQSAGKEVDYKPQMIVGKAIFADVEVREFSFGKVNRIASAEPAPEFTVETEPVDKNEDGDDLDEIY